MRLNWKLAAKVAGALVFVMALGVNAAQGYSASDFVVPPAAHFGLFILSAILQGAQLVLPRPGEPHERPGLYPPRG